MIVMDRMKIASYEDGRRNACCRLIPLFALLLCGGYSCVLVSALRLLATLDHARK